MPVGAEHGHQRPDGQHHDDDQADDQWSLPPGLGARRRGLGPCLLDPRPGAGSLVRPSGVVARTALLELVVVELGALRLVHRMTVLVDVARRRPPARACGRSPGGPGPAGSARCRPRRSRGTRPRSRWSPGRRSCRPPGHDAAHGQDLVAHLDLGGLLARLVLLLLLGAQEQEVPGGDDRPPARSGRSGSDFLAVVALSRATAAADPLTETPRPRRRRRACAGPADAARRGRPAGREFRRRTGAPPYNLQSPANAANAGRTPSESPDRLPPAVAGRRPGRMPDRTGVQLEVQPDCNVATPPMQPACRTITDEGHGRPIGPGSCGGPKGPIGRPGHVWEGQCHVGTGRRSERHVREGERPSRSATARTVRIGGRGPWLHLPRARRRTGPAGTRTGRVGEACGRDTLPITSATTVTTGGDSLGPAPDGAGCGSHRGVGVRPGRSVGRGDEGGDRLKSAFSVLAIEDDPDIRQLLGSLLGPRGLRGHRGGDRTRGPAGLPRAPSGSGHLGPGPPRSRRVAGPRAAAGRE